VSVVPQGLGRAAVTAGTGFIRCGCRDHAHGTRWTRHPRLTTCC